MRNDGGMAAATPSNGAGALNGNDGALGAGGKGLGGGNLYGQNPANPN